MGHTALFAYLLWGGACLFSRQATSSPAICSCLVPTFFHLPDVTMESMHCLSCFMPPAWTSEVATV